MLRKSEMTDDEKKNLLRKILVRFLLLPVFLGFLTLLPAGTFNYRQLYVYMIFLIIPMIFVLVYFLKKDPQFLERRTRTIEKEKTQKIIQVVFTLFFISAFIVSGLDRRFGWSDVPFSMTLSADFISLAGYLVVFFVFRQNSYASRIVEVDRSQTVITTGLYSVIRHPMYAGVIIMWIPIPVALGSYTGLIPMAAVPLALVLRIINEESVLTRDLPGYKEYCLKTKYRLIPFIW